MDPGFREKVDHFKGDRLKWPTFSRNPSLHILMTEETQRLHRFLLTERFVALLTSDLRTASKLLLETRNTNGIHNIKMICAVSVTVGFVANAAKTTAI